MPTRLAPLALVAVVLSACGHLTPDAASEALQHTLDAAVADDADIRNAALSIVSPKLGLAGAWAAGVAGGKTQRAMTPDTPFLSASIGKLVVAATTMSLIKDGLLNVDDPVGKWVARADLACLLPGGGSAALNTITVEQLLTHRSGLADYFEGTAHDGAPHVLALIAAEPERSWSTDALLAYTCAHFAPVQAPGAGFHYADTNYDLLGLVLESATGKPLATIVRDTVLAPLGMQHTWYHALEPAPAGLPDMADVYIGDLNVAPYASLSADQAGGGLVTTLADLDALVAGLVAGKPVALSTLDTQSSTDALNAGIDYGRGTFHIRPGGIFFALAMLPDLIGHSGATGSFAYYIPQHDARVVGTFNQTTWAERHVEFLLSDVLPILERVAP